MNKYSFDYVWLDCVYYVDAEVLEHGTVALDDDTESDTFEPKEDPVFGLTISDCWGEELEYADDILIDVATQIACNLYWFEISLDNPCEEDN